MVSLSSDPEHRNFTLGQQNRDLHFRVRTPLTGTNGSIINLIARNVLKDLEMHQVVVTFYRGVERLFVDGTPQFQLIRGDIDYLPILLKMGRTQAAKFICIFMISFPFSFMLGLPISKHLILWMVVLTVGSAVVIQLTANILFGQPLGIWIPLISGIGGILAAFLWRMISTTSHSIQVQ